MGVGVEVMTLNVMNVVNLDILQGSVACALVHVAWVVEGGEVQVLIIGVAEVQVMGMAAGVLVLVGEDLQRDVAYHLLIGVAATAGPLHTDMPAVIHLMPMEIEIGCEWIKC